LDNHHFSLRPITIYCKFISGDVLYPFQYSYSGYILFCTTVIPVLNPIRIWTDYRNRMDCLGIQRQQVAFIFQQDNGLFRYMPRQINSSFSVNEFGTY